MPRSKWKGLFCDVAVTKHVQKVLDGQPQHTVTPNRTPPPTDAHTRAAVFIATLNASACLSPHSHAPPLRLVLPRSWRFQDANSAHPRVVEVRHRCECSCRVRVREWARCEQTACCHHLAHSTAAHCVSLSMCGRRSAILPEFVGYRFEVSSRAATPHTTQQRQSRRGAVRTARPGVRLSTGGGSDEKNKSITLDTAMGVRS